MDNNLAYAQESKKIHARLTAQSKIFEKKIYQTAERFYTAVGWAIETPVMVVGDEGIIIIDPCESHDAMVEIMAELRKISQLPVQAVVYTHHHPDHWAGVEACTTQEDVNQGKCAIIAHRDFEEQVAKMTGILADIKIGRAMYMYGYLLPFGEDGRVNLGLGPMMRKDTQGYIAPTVLVDKELKFRAAGIDMEFYHIPSECVDEICVWFPQDKVLHVAECIQGENYPNLYSIRGSNRDPVKWVRSIDFMRTLPAEHFVGNHMRPVNGADECRKHLIDYRDMIQYTHDQTIRLINKGLTPDNIIAELEKLPPHLHQRARMGEHYGTFKQAVKLIFSHYVGWFQGDAAFLDPLTPAASAEKLLSLIGRDNLLAQGKKALEDGEYQWAAELLTIPVRARHDDMEARKLKAQALRQLAYRTENGPFRNWYLTQAQNLEGMFEEISKKAPEFNGPEVYYDAISKVQIPYLLDCLQVKLNGPKTQDVETAVTLKFTDDGYERVIEIRRGVCEIHESGKRTSDGTINISKTGFGKLLTKLVTVKDVLSAGDLQSTLSPDALEQFFGYFDGFTPLFDMEFPFE